MGRSETKGKRSKVREIAAATIRLATGGEPPGRARIRALYPDAHHDTFAEGYRIGCLDLILAPGGKPLTGETTEEREVIKGPGRATGRLEARAPGLFRPGPFRPPGGLRGRGGPTARARPGDSRRDGPGSPAAADR
jgi:hypothetical protein